GREAASAARDGGGLGFNLDFNQTLRAIWEDVREQLTESLAVALAPLVWLAPAFAIAYFARTVTDYLNRSAGAQGTVFDLFNPFSPISRANYGLGLATVLLGLGAVVLVALAVAIVEREGGVVDYALEILRAAGRVLLVIWVFFIYSLAVINALAILLGVTTLLPFQVGAPSLISLLGALVLFWRESRRQPRQSTSEAVQVTGQSGRG